MTRTSLFAVFQTAWSCTGKDEEEEMVKKKKRRDTEKEREGERSGEPGTNCTDTVE